MSRRNCSPPGAEAVARNARGTGGDARCSDPVSEDVAARALDGDQRGPHRRRGDGAGRHPRPAGRDRVPRRSPATSWSWSALSTCSSSRWSWPGSGAARSNEALLEATSRSSRAEGGWRVTLDGRPIRTQGGARAGRAQPRAGRSAGRRMARPGRGDRPDGLPAARPRRLRDRPWSRPTARRRSPGCCAYAETDTLCYRADPDEPLYRRQQALWEPLLAGFEARHGVGWSAVSGIIHRPQPAATMARLRAVLEAQDDFTLAALDHARPARRLADRRAGRARTRRRPGGAVRRGQLRAGLAGRAMGLGRGGRARPARRGWRRSKRREVRAAGARLGPLADPLRDFARDLVGGLVERRADRRRRRRRRGTRLSKRRVRTWPSGVCSTPS